MIALFCSRYRDIPQVIANLIQVSFFLTPVFWKAELLNDKIDSSHSVFIIEKIIENKYVELLKKCEHKYVELHDYPEFMEYYNKTKNEYFVVNESYFNKE